MTWNLMPQWKIFLGFAFKVAVSLGYLVIGVVFYALVEEKECEGTNCTCASGTVCMEPWTIIDSLYFCMVSMSTVGYGDLTPSSTASRAFTSVYAFFGIAIVFYQLSTMIASVFSSLETAISEFYKKHCCCRPKRIDIDNDGEADVEKPARAIVFYSLNIFPHLVGGLLFILLASAAIFMSFEDEWSLGDAVYHCWITALTVGYGDVYIATQGGRLWACFQILLSTTYIAYLVSKLQSLHGTREQQLKKYDLLQKQLDEQLITSLDKDGNGLNKEEFVLGMLKALEIISDEDTRDFEKQFDKLDVDGSGKLNKQDLEKMVQMKRNRQMRSPCPERPSITRPWNLSSEEAPPLSRQSSPVSKPHDTDAGAQAQLPGPHAHAQPQPRDTPHNVPLTPLLQTLPANKSSAQRSVTANAVQPSVTSRPYTAGCTNPAACANAADTYPVATHQPGGYAGNYLPEAGACSRNVGTYSPTALNSRSQHQRGRESREAQHRRMLAPLAPLEGQQNNQASPSNPRITMSI
uniref:EF-hand domain-containing protein n=1 Tax=Chrysotila carterae TaxID=13221 RepID=A0A7S4C0C4_CHRCT